MASAATIRREIETIERRYSPESPPENLSMAASCAMLLEDRTGYATRADVREHLGQVEPDDTITEAEIRHLRRLAR